MAIGVIWGEIWNESIWNNLIWSQTSDTTAPVISSPTFTSLGSTSVTLRFTTDEGNGTGYGVVSTSNTQPSEAQIIAGQDHLGTDVPDNNVSVSAIGTVDIPVTGLTASTAYYGHMLHQDAATNDSNIVSTIQFTTNEAADGTDEVPNMHYSMSLSL